MQLNDRYIDWYAEMFWDSDEPFDWQDPGCSIVVGVRYLRWIKERYPAFNDWQLVLAYNAGPERVKRGNVPRSTLAYADSVFAKYNELRKYKW
jgi:soluble lytic murein transglycosylase-like protein